MMRTVKRWVTTNWGSPSTSWLLLAPAAAPLVATCMRAVPGAAQMYFDMHLRHRVRRMLPFLDPFVSIDISSKPAAGADYGLGGESIKSSDAYEEVKAYLSDACGRDARQLHADGDGFVLSLRDGQEVADEFRGAALWWSSVPPGKQGQAGGGGNRHCLRLTFDQRHRRLVVDEYLPHVRRSGRDVMFRNRRRRLYTNKKNLDYSSKVWKYIDFDHPTTFETLAMHPAKKRMIMDDLDDFRGNKDYYRRIGKAWKRGYLLHGPPGTGKSTMIAAMANYLGYDIYDIELTMVQSNNDLRKLFIETTGKSIIVIEDIDCSVDLTGDRQSSRAAPAPVPATAAAATAAKRKRTSEVTLSGLLKFIDGLWSAHSGERIVVFTTNHVDKLDPALIRRGRMDMHIEMSYRGFEAFKTLAKNYLGVDAHPLFAAVEELMRVVQITPADVAECLMVSKRTDRGADACLVRLIDELKKKKAATATEKETKQTSQEEEEEEPANVTKPNDTSTDGRRVIDVKSIRRVKKKKVAKKEKEKEEKEKEGGNGTATAMPEANGREAMANGGTESCVGVGANDDPNDDDDTSSDNHGDMEKVEVDTETNNGVEAMATVSVGGAGGGTVDADDYGDGSTDDDFDDMDYDEDDSDL